MGTVSEVVATAPGKVILMGEHAAVYGRPAVVAALGLRTTVRLRRREGRGVVLRLRNLGVEAAADWEELAGLAARAQRVWEAHLVDPSTSELMDLASGDPAHVVKIALAETLRALGGAADPRAADGVEVEVSSELPVGSGFGSSASVAVAVAGALAVLLEGARDDAVIERVALEAERRQHGTPSGVDHGTVLRGGVLWMQPDGEGGVHPTPLEPVPDALDGLAVCHTGTPIETTGEAIAAVRRRFAGRRADLEVILDGIGEDAGELRRVLTGARPARRLGELLRSCERHLEALGVVPERVRRIVRALEDEGGSAKISGAGGISGGRAGSLLAYHPERDASELPALSGLRHFRADLGVAGLEVDAA